MLLLFFLQFTQEEEARKLAVVFFQKLCFADRKSLGFFCLINESEDGPDYYRVFPHFHIGHHACLAKKCQSTPPGDFHSKVHLKTVRWRLSARNASP